MSHPTADQVLGAMAAASRLRRELDAMIDAYLARPENQAWMAAELGEGAVLVVPLTEVNVEMRADAPT